MSVATLTVGADGNRFPAFEPEPAWAAPWPVWTRTSERLTQGGLKVLLRETQISLLQSEPVRLHRTMTVVTAPEGLAPVGRFEIDWSPEHERVRVHRLEVVRGSERRSFARPESFEVIRRERDLENATVDGRLTAFVQLPDLRVGDQVITAYSVEGGQHRVVPRFSCRISLQLNHPVGCSALRLLSPANRTFAFQAWGACPEPELISAAGVEDRWWRMIDVQPFAYAHRTPDAFIGHAELLMAETLTWAEAASTFAPLYAPPPALPPELDALRRDAERTFADPRDRFAWALRLVQSEVRYLSVTLDEGGYVPRTVEQAWAERRGDCKDAARVLTALCRGMGLDVTPALVDTSGGEELNTSPPNVLAFDHCLVRLRVDGRTWWFDPTLRPQRARFDRLLQSRFGWALPLEVGEELEFMGRDEPLLEFEQEASIVFGPFPTSAADLRLTTTFRGWLAADLRAGMLAYGPQGVERSEAEWADSAYGGAERAADMTHHDDVEENVLTFTGLHRLVRPWAATGPGWLHFQSDDTAFGQDLNLPHETGRDQPLSLGRPRTCRRRLTLELPARWSGQGWTRADEAAGVSYASALTVSEDGRRVVLDTRLRIEEPVIEPEDLPDYFALQESARMSGVASITLAGGRDRFKGRGLPLSAHAPRWLWGGMLVVWLASLAYFILLFGMATR